MAKYKIDELNEYEESVTNQCPYCGKTGFTIWSVTKNPKIPDQWILTYMDFHNHVKQFYTTNKNVYDLAIKSIRLKIRRR